MSSYTIEVYYQQWARPPIIVPVCKLALRNCYHYKALLGELHAATLLSIIKSVYWNVRLEVEVCSRCFCTHLNFAIVVLHGVYKNVSKMSSTQLPSASISHRYKGMGWNKSAPSFYSKAGDSCVYTVARSLWPIECSQPHWRVFCWCRDGEYFEVGCRKQ
jgi:hypothetical protein